MELPLPSDDALLDAVVRSLADSGPLSFAELSVALGEDPDDPEWDDAVCDLLDRFDRVEELSDERLTDVVTLLAATTLTHRLDADEAAGGYIELGGDLQPYVPIVDGSVPLARAGRAHVELAARPGRAATERLVGPPGWLAGAAAGDLVGLRLHEGLLHVIARPEPVDHAAAAGALARAAELALDRSDDGDDPPRAPITGVLWEAIAAAPQAFAGVLPPLSELAAAAGLTVTEALVLPAGADTSTIRASTDAVFDAIATVHDDADDALLADLAMVRATGRRIAAGGPVPVDDLRAAGRALLDPVVLDCLVREAAIGGDPGPLGAALIPVTTGTAQARAHYLVAEAARRAGDALAAEAALGAALHADPDLAPAMVDAARLADVRGDAETALQLLGRAGWGDTGWADSLRGYAAGPKVARNAPCPCGSGRKSKVCCAGRAGGPLPARAGWLLAKLRAYGDALPLDRRLRQRLAAAGRLADWAEDADEYPILADVTVFDLGVLDDFLADWGPLLPADERDLAAQWQATHRGLYRVERSRGDEVFLTERGDGTPRTARAADAVPPSGRLVLTRLLPDGGGGLLLVAGTLVDEEHHPAIARSTDPQADPLDVAELWGPAPPVLANAEGEPTMAIVWQARLEAGSSGPLREHLAAAGLVEEGPGSFVETVEVGRQRKVRGTVSVTDGLVAVDTNSEVRLQRLVALITEVTGDLDVVADRRTPMWRAVADQQLYGVAPEPTEPSAEEVAVLAEVLREQERLWLDEPVPALDNLTPREARDHPTGRSALEGLLADLARSPGMFDAERLRALLDLPPGPPST